MTYRVGITYSFKSPEEVKRRVRTRIKRTVDNNKAVISLPLADFNMPMAVSLRYGLTSVVIQYSWNA